VADRSNVKLSLCLIKQMSLRLVEDLEVFLHALLTSALDGNEKYIWQDKRVSSENIYCSLMVVR